MARDRASRQPAVALLAALIAGAWIGRTVPAGGVVTVAAVLVAVGGFALLLRSVWFSIVGVLAVVALLPFATLPVGASVTPTLLELALLAAFVVAAAVLLLDRREALRVGWPSALALLFIGMTAFAFLLGLGRGYTTQTLHDYLKLVLAIAWFFVVVQIVRRVGDAKLVLWLLLAVIAAAGLIATGLYIAGPAVSERLLLRLVPYGYPGSRVVRFIEDDPAKPMRAIGTSVDPNSFGGLLMIGFVLAAGQLLARRRSVHPGVALGAAAATGVPLLLTYSRGAWVGAFVGVGVVLLLRRRMLIFPVTVAGAVAVWIGVGAGFVERLWQGFMLQDPATRLRLSEYRNAWEIIQLHPWFGVGYGEAPSIELQTGVSSAYLTVAEQAGLVGLAVFLVAVMVVLAAGIWRSIHDPDSERRDLTLCFTAVFAAALTVGLVDHYLVNPQFPHMVAIFWTVAAVVVALSTSTREAPSHAAQRGGVVSSRATASGPRQARL